MNWPPLLLEQWQPTRDTVHLWTQMVGKTRLGLAPQVNHWWNSTLYVTARGLTTSLMPYPGGGAEIEFDFIRHELTITTTGGTVRRMALAPRPVADFYAEYRSHLDSLGIDVADQHHAMRDPGRRSPSRPTTCTPPTTRRPCTGSGCRWSARTACGQFRGGLPRQGQPGPFLLGSLRPGGHPVLRAARTALSRPGPELPGLRHGGGLQRRGIQLRLLARRGRGGLFYSYAYPAPPGFADHPAAPAAAYFDEQLGEFVLPYAAVRTAADPDAYLTEFLESTFRAARDLANWPAVTTE